MKKVQYCKECRQEFDPSRGGYFDKADNTYICLSCGETVPIGDTVVPIFKKQSKKSIIIKLVFAALCIGASFNSGAEEVGSTVILICTGLILIACTVIPFIRDRKRMEAYKEKLRMKKDKEKSVYRKCAHCGASSTGDICSYCGSPLDQK